VVAVANRFVVLPDDRHESGKKATVCSALYVDPDRDAAPNSARLTDRTRSCIAGVDEVPDFVFLAHVVDVMQSLHVSFVLRTFASTPFCVQLFLLPMWPFAFLIMLAMWACSKTFVISCYNLRGRLHQIWAVPRYGFQVRNFISACLCV
jgi:hypothetical protein